MGESASPSSSESSSARQRVGESSNPGEGATGLHGAPTALSNDPASPVAPSPGSKTRHPLPGAKTLGEGLVRDAWAHLRRITPARIALGRAGGSLPTHEVLDFQIAHARAQDAVLQPFDAESLRREIESLNVRVTIAYSRASDRQIYLRRPDLGRTLDDASARDLQALAATDHDVAIIASDGLSAAASRQVVPMLRAFLPLAQQQRWQLAPIVIVPFARVAIQDPIGHALRAKAAVILLGERPGLGSPDSLGAYLVFDPKPGRTDADRNCISNIRPEGLPPQGAARQLHHLLHAALRHRLSGVSLKVDSPPPLSSPT
jgi:ethanolamine ammonia-lyase small subunit